MESTHSEGCSGDSRKLKLHWPEMALHFRNLVTIPESLPQSRKQVNSNCGLRFRVVDGDRVLWAGYYLTSDLGRKKDFITMGFSVRTPRVQGPVRTPEKLGFRLENLETL